MNMHTHILFQPINLNQLTLGSKVHQTPFTDPSVYYADTGVVRCMILEQNSVPSPDWDQSQLKIQFLWPADRSLFKLVCFI